MTLRRGPANMSLSVALRESEVVLGHYTATGHGAGQPKALQEVDSPDEL